MATLKKKELKALSDTALREKLQELQMELMKLSAQRAVGTTLENPGKVRAIRKLIARIYTFLHQRSLQQPTGGGVNKA